jgi:hypothetical protein
MSERNKPHNGRDVDGHFKVKQADVDDLETDPNGVDFIRDDVRLGGAVADVGAGSTVPQWAASLSLQSCGSCCRRAATFGASL